MKKLFSAPIRKLLLTAVLVTAALLDVLLLSTDAYGYYGGNLLTTAFSVHSFGDTGLLACAGIVLCCAVTLLFSVYGVIAVLVSGRGEGPALYAGCASNLAVLILGGVSEMLTGAAVACGVFALLLLAGGIVYSILGNHFAPQKDNRDDTDAALTQREKTGKLLLSIISFISCLSMPVLFCTPFVTYVSRGEELTAAPLDALSGITNSLVFFVFLAGFAVCIVSLSVLIRTINRFGSSAATAVRAAGRLIYTNLGLTGAYFLGSFVYTFILNALGHEYYAGAAAPLVVSAVCTLVFVCVKGQIFPAEDKETGSGALSVKARVWRILLLSSVGVFTLLSFLTLGFNIINAKYISEYRTETIHINGLDLIKNYSEMSKSYRLLAFALLLGLVLSAIGLLISLAAFIGKSKLFTKISTVTIAVNVLCTTVVGICGKYFEMVQAVNMELIASLFPFPINPEDYGIAFKVTSQAYVPMLISIGLLVVLLVIAPFTRAESGKSVVREQSESDTENRPDVQRSSVHTDAPDFDACPAFTELDGQWSAYAQDTARRRRAAFPAPSLPEIVRFVVDYARDCRLHLSYRDEEIADFVAGLAATRLSILQGMSGTGKTSLPKIVSEALMGTCEIIEVESSWRDKNELLGYYNEFSRTYTPKKFTQALYRAKLNPDIPTFIVLDEMNLSRIEYYFSDFLSLMENEEDKRAVKLVNVRLYNISGGEKYTYRALTDDHTLYVPRNVWFIGTANRDESTFAISDKVYDRAHTMNFRRRAPAAQPTGEAQPPRFLSAADLLGLMEEAKDASEFSVEGNETIRLVEALLAPYNISFGNRVARQIEAYVKVYIACFRDPASRCDEALENILLSEVVAKLENKTVENKSALAAEFDKLGLRRCGEFVRRLNEEYL